MRNGKRERLNGKPCADIPGSRTCGDGGTRGRPTKPTPPVAKAHLLLTIFLMLQARFQGQGCACTEEEVPAWCVWVCNNIIGMSLHCLPRFPPLTMLLLVRCSSWPYPFPWFLLLIAETPHSPQLDRAVRVCHGEGGWFTQSSSKCLLHWAEWAPAPLAGGTGLLSTPEAISPTSSPKVCFELCRSPLVPPLPGHRSDPSS